VRSIHVGDGDFNAPKEPMISGLTLRPSCLSRRAKSAKLWSIALTVRLDVSVARSCLPVAASGQRKPVMSWLASSSSSAHYVFYAFLAALCSATCVAYVSARKMVQALNRDCCNSTSASTFEDPWHAKRLPVPSIHSEPSKSLTVIFPAYNESSRMDPALEEAVEFLNVKRKRDPNFSFEIIVVDDGSTDDTYQHGMTYVQRLGIDTFRVLRFACNQGKGAAVRAGVLASRGQLILFADADGATQFSDFDRLHERMKGIAASASQSEDSSMFSGIASKHGFLAGSRAHLESSEAVTKRQWYRNAMMHGFHALVTVVAGKGIKDTQCGFKVRTSMNDPGNSR
jgi:dolichyl-phosphate beta-glucosyltransferase